jgi:uncharacterized protein
VTFVVMSRASRSGSVASLVTTVPSAMPIVQNAFLRQRLMTIARESSWFMAALRAVRELNLASWCIGAGAVRNLVWDELHKLPQPSPLTDVDVAYFDANDLSREHDAELQNRLGALLPGVPWEVTNQAGVHQWFESYFGHAVAPLLSLDEAVGSWPEYATSVSLTLRADDSLHVIAPHGLHDLFSAVVRRNPTRVSVETYRQRVLQKRYTERWKHVRVEHC